MPALPRGWFGPNEPALFLNKLLSEALFILQKTSFIFRVLSKHQLMNLVREKRKILGGEE